MFCIILRGHAKPGHPPRKELLLVDGPCKSVMDVTGEERNSNEMENRVSGV